MTKLCFSDTAVSKASSLVDHSVRPLLSFSGRTPLPKLNEIWAAILYLAKFWLVNLHCTVCENPQSPCTLLCKCFLAFEVLFLPFLLNFEIPNMLVSQLCIWQWRESRQKIQNNICIFFHSIAVEEAMTIKDFYLSLSQIIFENVFFSNFMGLQFKKWAKNLHFYTFSTFLFSSSLFSIYSFTNFLQGI